MFALRSFFVFLAFALILFLGCCGKSNVAVTTVSAESDGAPSDVPHERLGDDVARFVAGLPGKPGSPFLGLESSDAWKEHRRLLDEAWGATEGKLIRGLQDFQKTELTDATFRQGTVFYPFSGPDTLTVTNCFPQAPVYVMVGLEPAGTLPSATQIEKKDLDKYLPAIRATVASELDRSFFITRQMDRQFRGQVTDGLMLPILHLLVRTHHTILGFRYVRLDENGELIDRAANYHANGLIGNKGVEIEFKGDAEQGFHKLYYLSVNLSNQRLKQDPQFLMYLSRLKGSTTLLKATSYMTHKPTFSVIRDQILDISGSVLQDDSGIPFHYFDKQGWKVQLYGEYQRPYGSFRWLEQPDLRKAFASGDAKALAFRIGYGYSQTPSNLLLARRG